MPCVIAKFNSLSGSEYLLVAVIQNLSAILKNSAARGVSVSLVVSIT
jgi:hypothetical protein